MGEDGEEGHRDQRKGYDLSQAVSSVPLYAMLSCQSDFAFVQQQQQHNNEPQKPITTTESYDGGNEDVDDDIETTHVEYWSFWR